MKKIMFIAALLGSLFAILPAQAQVAVSVNIGAQPVWGPVGYDHVDYYYIPDVDAYYDVPARVFVYQDGGVWVRRHSLPPAFAGYDLYHGYKVVLNEPTPWVQHTVYRDRYIVYKGRKDQEFIRDSREPKYKVVKERPAHSNGSPQGRSGGNQKVQRQDGGNHPVQRQGGNPGGHKGGGGGHGGGHGKGH